MDLVLAVINRKFNIPLTQNHISVAHRLGYFNQGSNRPVIVKGRLLTKKLVDEGYTLEKLKIHLFPALSWLWTNGIWLTDDGRLFTSLYLLDNSKVTIR